MVAPTRLLWTAPDVNTDGSPFTREQYGGFEIEVDDQPAVAVPNAWDDDRMYEMDLALLQLPQGQHKARMRTVAANGLVSDWSNSVEFDTRVAPMPPLAFSVQ